jgi:UDP-N-acetylglucosamine 3-dehydrogenase
MGKGLARPWHWYGDSLSPGDSPTAVLPRPVRPISVCSCLRKHECSVCDGQYELAYDRKGGRASALAAGPPGTEPGRSHDDRQGGTCFMRLKIAVVGAGSMGMNHLRVLRDMSEEQVQVVGIAETHEPNLKSAVSRFHVPGYSDYREMVEKTRPDLVAVVVPTHLHFEVAQYVLDLGINVLIEKPMTSTIEEARALIQLAYLRNARLAVGHIERFNPAVIAVKRHLMDGELGKMFHLHARRLGPFPPRIRDVGVTLDLATHDIDVMRYLADAEIEHVYAETQRYIHTSHEDLVLGILRFTNQTIGVLDVNWLTPTKIRELSVTGEKGMYLVNYLTQDVYFYQNDYTTTSWDALRSLTGVSEGTMTRLKIQKAEPLRLEYEDVMAAIQQDTVPTVSGEDGLAVLRVVLKLSEPAVGALSEACGARFNTLAPIRLANRISY